MKKIDHIIAALQKQFGENIIRMGNQIPEVTCFPTGIPQLDADLGGGILWNRIAIFKGKEQTGKTSIVSKIAGKFQSVGGIVEWFDLEHAFDKKRAKLFGLNTDENFIYISEEVTAENVFVMMRDSIREFKKEKVKSLFVVDSLAANMSERLQNEDTANKVYGGSAILNNQSITVWNNILGPNQILIVVNQLRDNLDPMAKKDNTPGGWAQNYFASSIVSMRQAETIKEGTTIVGQDFKWTIEKSRASSPKQIGSIKFDYSRGFDITEGIIDTAEEMGLITKGGGGWYDLPEGVTLPDGNNRVRGKETFLKLMREHPETMNSILKVLYTRFPTPIWDGELKDETE